MDTDVMDFMGDPKVVEEFKETARASVDTCSSNDTSSSDDAGLTQTSAADLEQIMNQDKDLRNRVHIEELVLPGDAEDAEDDLIAENETEDDAADGVTHDIEKDLMKFPGENDEVIFNEMAANGEEWYTREVLENNRIGLNHLTKPGKTKQAGRYKVRNMPKPHRAQIVGSKLAVYVKGGEVGVLHYGRL